MISGFMKFWTLISGPLLFIFYRLHFLSPDYHFVISISWLVFQSPTLTPKLPAG